MTNAESAADVLMPAPSPVAAPSVDRLDYVDGLRAVAALMVVLDHMQIMIYNRTPRSRRPPVSATTTLVFLYGH